MEKINCLNPYYTGSYSMRWVFETVTNEAV